MSQVNKVLTASLDRVVEFNNPSRATVLRMDVENTGAAAFTGWKVMASAVRGAPMRDITPASITSADGYTVVTPAPRGVATLAAGANTQITLNASMWDRIEVYFSGANAQATVHWEGIE
jgi:hypothetical protein